MLNKRGQEGAPFELLVAVIVMGFVIFIGLQAMKMLNDQRCYNETDQKVETLKTLLETVVTEGSAQNIRFSMADCYNENDMSIRIKDYSEPALCASYCGSARNLCTLLQLYHGGDPSFSIRKCLNISPDTVFPYNVGTCPEKPEYELVDFRDQIVQGTYLLTNQTSATSTYPTVCAYRKTNSIPQNSPSGWPLSCLNNISSKLNALKSDVENGVSPLDFSLNTGCPELDGGTIKLINNCGSECPTSGKCLQYTYYGANNYSKTVCVNS